jgi:hypothetical protein
LAEWSAGTFHRSTAFVEEAFIRADIYFHNEPALGYCSLADLKRFALDLA